jgi:hypothetical protein
MGESSSWDSRPVISIRRTDSSTVATVCCCENKMNCSGWRDPTNLSLRSRKDYQWSRIDWVTLNCDGILHTLRTLWWLINIYIYESMKRKLLKPTDECRCNGRLQTKRFTSLSHTFHTHWVGRDWVASINVYYESIKREPKIKGIYECRCDERLQTKTKKFTRLPYTGLVLELEHLKIETRLINERFANAMGECEN